MARRRKLPECECAACKRFNVDGVELYVTIERGELRSLTPNREFLQELKQHLIPDGACDLCGQEWSNNIPHVPQIIKDFFRVERMCYGCRSRLRDIQREHEWPICWGSTSDDEIKWLLMWLQLENFNKAVRALSPAQVEKDKAFQVWLDSLPKYEAEPPQEIEFSVKRRVRPRDTTATV